ncbi:hypothetical protein HYS93_00905 [Candidatus Daviesbacteria bacterium]|nr:hypothetical protein [Candidatus Daviesbacteria bacterium]
MVSSLKDAATFLLAALLAGGIVYYRLPVTAIQQAVIVLLLILLFFLNKFVFKKVSIISSGFYRAGFLFISSLFVQFLILSSGGFYSPFFILIHLFTLGASFLLSRLPALTFLISALITVGVYTWFNPAVKSMLLLDPGPVLLYVSSLVVIIPLVIYLSRYYHLKDKLLKIISQEMRISKLQQQSLLRGVSEFVLVTDQNLKVVSVGEAVERSLDVLSSEIVGKNLLEVIHIQDESTLPVSISSLSIDRVLIEKTSRIIKGYYVQLRPGAKASKVSIQIRPIADEQGIVTHLIFVISPDQAIVEEQQHSKLEQVLMRHTAMTDNIKKELSSLNLPLLQTELEFLTKTEQDLFTSFELEDHPIKEVKTMTDTAYICQQIINLKQSLAKSIGVRLKLTLPKEEVFEIETLKMPLTEHTKKELDQNSAFSAAVDIRWFSILISKLVDLAILLSSEKNDSVAELSLAKVNPQTVDITISANCTPLPADGIQQIFTEYYGDLSNRSNLRLGSGLEGYMAKVISEQLEVPLTAENTLNPPGLLFRLRINRNAG